MAERITLIQVNRDKHDEIISCIVRQDATGVIKEFKKDDVKKYIGSNVWKVDRLFLSTDGKLRVREKDTLIDDYIDACKLIGIEPLSIQKQGNEYIVYDIPKCKNIQIPGFVTKLYVSKDVRCNVQSQQAQSAQYNNTKGVTKESIDLKLETICRFLIKEIENLKQDDVSKNTKLDKILQDLHTFSNSVNKETTDIDNELNNIDSMLAQLQNTEDSYGIALSTGLNELKQDMSLNGLIIQDLGRQLAPLISNLTQQYRQSALTGSVGGCDITNLNGLPNYLTVSEDKYICKDESKYDSFVALGNEECKLAPFNFFSDVLKVYLQQYSKIYDMVNNQLKTMNDNEAKDLCEFKTGRNKINATINGLGWMAPDSIRALVLTLKGFKALSLGIGELQVNSAHINDCKKIYNNNNLDMFYNETDKDITDFLIEYRVIVKHMTLSRLKGITDKQLRYKVIFDLIKHIKSDIKSIDLTEETIKRIALAYIMSMKILDGDIQEIVVPLNPAYKYEDIYSAEMAKLEFLGTVSTRDYKRFYMSVHYFLMYSILVMEGFNPKYAYTKIIGNMKSIDDLDTFDLVDADMRAMYFKMSDYIH